MVYVKMVNDKLIAGGRIGGIRGMSPGFATIPLPRLPPGSLRSPNFFLPTSIFSPFSPKAEPDPRRTSFPPALLSNHADDT